MKMYPWYRNRNNRECYLDTTKTPYTDRHNINEFITEKKERKGWQKVIPKDKDNRFNMYKWNPAYKSDPKEAKETAQSKLKRFQDSLKNRGSAREAASYNPPQDVEERIVAIYKSMSLGEALSDEATVLDINLNESRSLKFNLLTKCIEEFGHDLPTSHLTEIETIQDLVAFYSTPVRGVNPYTSMLRQEDSLPANLSLIAEPIRFNKESDQFFNGITAYPGQVNKVSGLRGSKKFPTLNQDEFQWPDI